MNRRFAQVLVLLLVLLLCLSPMHAFAQSGEQKTVRYVSLGNSLAAGMLYNYTFGKGYPVFIEHHLADEGYKVRSTRRGIAGFTTGNVLWQLDVDHILRHRLKSADIVTIDAGANDVIGAVGNVYNLDPDMTEEERQEIVSKAAEATAQVKKNMGFILEIVKYLNEDAEIYVMGYYNAFPYLDEDLQPLIVDILEELNHSLESVAESKAATYVSTFDVFEGHYEEYLPVETNIHPNEAGYEAIAEAFLEYILPDLAEDPGTPGDPEEPGDLEDYTLSSSHDELELTIGQTAQLEVELADPDGETINVTEDATYASSHPEIVEADEAGLLSGKNLGAATINVTYESLNTEVAVEVVPGTVHMQLGETTTVNPGDRVTITNTSTELIMPLDLPLRSSLSVSAADEPNEEDLAIAGDVLDFEVQYPDGYEDDPGEFLLTMGYDPDYEADAVGIYHLKEDGVWEKRDGLIDEAAGLIEWSTPHPGTYGVFAAAAPDPDNDSGGTNGSGNHDSNRGNDGTGDDDSTPGHGPSDKSGTVFPAAKDPAHPGSPSQSGSQSGKLPATAAFHHNLLLLGIFLLVIGVAHVVVGRKRLPFPVRTTTQQQSP